MERGWTKTNRIVRNTIYRLGKKFKKECKKDRVLFLHEADVQARLYSEIAKRFNYPVSSSSGNIAGTTMVHIETHVKGWGKEDVLDLVICPRKDSIVFKGPKNQKYGNIGFYNAKIARENRSRVCAIEIKYNRYRLKNSKQGIRKNRVWNDIRKDLRKLRRFGRGYFIYVSNIIIEKDMIDELRSKYLEFAKQKLKKSEWKNVKFFYCDPLVQKWL